MLINLAMAMFSYDALRRNGRLNLTSLRLETAEKAANNAACSYRSTPPRPGMPLASLQLIMRAELSIAES